MNYPIFTPEQADKAVLNCVPTNGDERRIIVAILANSPEFISAALSLAKQDSVSLESMLATLSLGVLIGLRISQFSEVPHESVH